MQSKLNFFTNGSGKKDKTKVKDENKISLNKNVTKKPRKLLVIDNQDYQNDNDNLNIGTTVDNEVKDVDNGNNNINNNVNDNINNSINDDNDINTKTKEVLQLKKGQLKSLDDSDYDCLVDCPFVKDSNVPFFLLCNTFEQVSQIKGQNSKERQKELLSRMLRTVLCNKKDQLVMVYYLCTMRLAPDYLGQETGVGEAIIVKAISRATGRTDKQIRNALKEQGDLGKVAMISKTHQSTVTSFFNNNNNKHQAASEDYTLSVKEVFQQLEQIVITKGNNAEEKKQNILVKLFLKSRGEEIKYLVRWIQGNLKISVGEASMQSSLSKCFYDNSFPRKSRSKEGLEEYEKVVKRAVCEYPHQGHIIQALATVGQDINQLLNHCHIRPGVPIKPMLAKPMKDLQMILRRFDNLRFTCEYKYDGLRGQIHYHEGQVDVYSRNLQNMNQTYPDIIQLLQHTFGTQCPNFVMDSEIVAVDVNTGAILPFQTLTSRSRKNVQVQNINIKVCVFMFDLLYYNGESLLQKTLEERRQVIFHNFKEQENKLMYAIHKNTDNLEEIEDILDKSIKSGCEGLMMKTLDTNSTYEPSKRSFKWLKLKKDYLDNGCGDTFDLVPLGAFYGTGKRQGVYGSYLLACWDEEGEYFQTCCKIGTGFSEQLLKDLHTQLATTVIQAPQDEYKVKGFKCDVWFSPTQVWEVKAADLQLSPVYTSGMAHLGGEKGIGMRFPRFIRQREDKGVYDATTSEFIYDIYKTQTAVANKMNFNDVDDMY